MNGRGFRAEAVAKGGFPVINSPDNGERVHSLLCGREALAKPPGAAGISPKGSDLTRRNRSTWRVSGRSLTRRIWRAGGTPKTHLVRVSCCQRASGNEPVFQRGLLHR